MLNGHGLSGGGGHPDDCLETGRSIDAEEGAETVECQREQGASCAAMVALYVIFPVVIESFGRTYPVSNSTVLYVMCLFLAITDDGCVPLREEPPRAESSIGLHHHSGAARRGGDDGPVRELGHGDRGQRDHMTARRLASQATDCQRVRIGTASPNGLVADSPPSTRSTSPQTSATTRS